MDADSSGRERPNALASAASEGFKQLGGRVASLPPPTEKLAGFAAAQRANGTAQSPRWPRCVGQGEPARYERDSSCPRCRRNGHRRNNRGGQGGGGGNGPATSAKYAQLPRTRMGDDARNRAPGWRRSTDLSDA